MKFLKHFPKDPEGMYIIYELYSFDNFFRLLLKGGYGYRDSLMFVLANCSLNALIFQERIYNKEHLKLYAKDALSPQKAAIKSQLIFDILECIKN